MTVRAVYSFAYGIGDTVILELTMCADNFILEHIRADNSYYNWRIHIRADNFTLELTMCADNFILEHIRADNFILQLTNSY